MTVWFDTVFLLVTAVTGTAAVLVACLVLYTVVLRLQHERRERRWAYNESEWSTLVSEALSDARFSNPVVSPQNARDYIEYLYRVSLRFQDDEADTLRRLALPHLPVLLEELHQHSPETRAGAVLRLRALGDASVDPYLLRALDDLSPLVAMAGFLALAQPGAIDSGRHILQRLDRFDYWNDRQLASILAGIGTDLSSDLRLLFGDDGASIRKRVIAGETLVLLQSYLADDTAALLTRNDEPEIVSVALRLLAKSGRPRHIDAVAEKAAHPSFFVRSLAMSTLGAIGGVAEIPLLTQHLSDDSTWVVLRAAEAIVAVGGTAQLLDIARSGHVSAKLALQVYNEATQ